MASIFMQIIKNEIPAVKIYEDSDIIAILDINPHNKGHALVIPKEEHETIIECPEGLLHKMISVAKKVAKKQMDELKCDGVNILMNNKVASGQLVPHVHMHVIPRFANDGYKLGFGHVKYYESEIEDFGKRLKI